MNNLDLIQAFLNNQKGRITSYNSTNDGCGGIDISLQAFQGSLDLKLKSSETSIITELLEFNIEKGFK